MLTPVHRQTPVYWGRYHLTKARITPRDTEGRLQRSFLWDKGIFGGGWWALDRYEWEAVLGKQARWSTVPSQQWDTKPREWLKQTQGTGECEETGSGRIVCQSWSPWQGLVVDSGFSTWLTPYIQTWKEMEQEVSSETPDFVFFQTQCDCVDKMKSSQHQGYMKSSYRSCRWSFHFHLLLVLGNYGPDLHRYFSAKRCNG